MQQQKTNTTENYWYKLNTWRYETQLLMLVKQKAVTLYAANLIDLEFLEVVYVSSMFKLKYS